MKPERITQDIKANEQLLYFTSSSLLKNDSRLVFLSDRTGVPNIFVRELDTGREKQLTYNKDGILKSYVYFDGLPYRGLSKAGISMHHQSGSIYYIQGREIRKVTLDGTEVTIASYPDGQMTAFTHVSEDGKFLCVPTTDDRALDGDKQLQGRPDYNIDERVQTERLCSYLRVFDTGTGREVLCERVEQSWITHVQFSPGNNSMILYNHEWPSDCGIRRMWLFNGKSHLRLRTESDYRSRHDWTCHEMWERDGSAIIYHGGFHQGPSYLGRVQPDGTGNVEIALPHNYKRYGHFTVGSPGVLVSDGYYEEVGDSNTSGGDWISRIDVDWNAGETKWYPLCRHLSSWTSQDAHPHPIIDHNMKYAYFTSDFAGKRAIYRVNIAKNCE
jgi:hypothetical protein